VALHDPGLTAKTVLEEKRDSARAKAIQIYPAFMANYLSQKSGRRDSFTNTVVDSDIQVGFNTGNNFLQVDVLLILNLTSNTGAP